MPMKVSVAYAHPGKLFLVTLDLPEGVTAGQAIERSGVLTKYPEIDLASQKVGVYGKVTPLDAPLYEGARLEIYRPITADPQSVKRRDTAPEKPN